MFERLALSFDTYSPGSGAVFDQVSVRLAHGPEVIGAFLEYLPSLPLRPRDSKKLWIRPLLRT